MYADGSTLICEMTGAGAALHAWQMSTQMVVLSSDKLLLHTDADPETWQPKLTALLQQDAQAAILRVKWRPSRHGGRPWAQPAAVQSQLAAARRTKGGRTGQTVPLRNIAEVHIRGPVGYDAHTVYRQLAAHVTQVAGIALVETTSDSPGTPGYWRWLGASDPTAPPGRLRLYLRSDDEVQKLYQALHERTLQVGMDHVALQVTNDRQDLEGNGRRGRGARQPAPAEQ